MNEDNGKSQFKVSTPKRKETGSIKKKIDEVLREEFDRDPEELNSNEEEEKEVNFHGSVENSKKELESVYKSNS